MKTLIERANYFFEDDQPAPPTNPAQAIQQVPAQTSGTSATSATPTEDKVAVPLEYNEEVAAWFTANKTQPFEATIANAKEKYGDKANEFLTKFVSQYKG